MRGRWGLLAAVGVILLFAAEGCTVLGSTYDRKVSEADNLAKQLGALQKKYDDLTAENGELKGRVAKLNSDLSAMTGQRDKLAQEKEKLSADLAEVTAQRDKLADDNRELDKVLKAKTDSLSTTVVELRRKIADLEAENGKLKAEVADKTKRIAALEAENARQKQEIAGLQKAKEEVVQKSSTYEKMLEKMKGEIAKGEVTISELKGKLTVNMVDAILFDSGKAEVKPEGLEVLKKVIAVLETVKDKAIRIEGHTDNVVIHGVLAKTFPTNWELSAARAINVTRYLQQQGIDPAVLSAVAFAEYRAVAPNDTPEGKAKNRRIEIVLVPKE